MPPTTTVAPRDQSEQPDSLARQQRMALRARREELALSADQVGALIGKRLRALAARFGEDPDSEDCRDLHGNTIRSWERFASHPSTARMAAWARVLGWRWVTGFAEPESGLVVTVHSPEAAEIARVADMLTADDLAWLLSAARRFFPNDGNQ